MEVKEALFQAAHVHGQHYLKLKQIMPDWNTEVIAAHVRFCALYEVIEASGLEEEYQKFKDEVRKNEEEKANS